MHPGDGVLAALAVTRLAGDVALVLALFIAASSTALVVGAVPGANGEVVLGAAVGADDVLWALDDQFCNGRRLRYADLGVEAVVPAVVTALSLRSL